MAITPLQDYEKACNRLKNAFIKSLYPDKEDWQRILNENEGYWIGGAVGEVFSWWDWFVHANDITNYFRYKLTPDEFFDYYDKSVEAHIKNKGYMNMKNYKLSLKLTPKEE